MTSDNVGTNDIAAHCIQWAEHVNQSDRPWKARQCRGRSVHCLEMQQPWSNDDGLSCMEHIVHLGAKDFIETLYPSKSKKTMVSNNANGNDSESGEDEEDDEGEEDWTVDWNELNSLLEEEEEIDEPVKFEPGDLLSKMLDFINQVHMYHCFLSWNFVTNLFWGSLIITSKGLLCDGM